MKLDKDFEVISMRLASDTTTGQSLTLLFDVAGGRFCFEVKTKLGTYIHTTFESAKKRFDAGDIVT